MLNVKSRLTLNVIWGILTSVSISRPSEAYLKLTCSFYLANGKWNFCIFLLLET